MLTEVKMKRELFGEIIQQSSKNEFFSATDLTRAGNKWRRANGLGDFNLSLYFQSKGSKEFISEIEKKYGNCLSKGRGRTSNTWVHPLLFIDIALTINPKLKVEVYEWLFDNLIRFRNDSGDSYKEMAATLYMRHNNHREFPKYIQVVANQIKVSCQVKDWQEATEQQLKQRDLIHNNIKLLCRVLTNTEQIVRIAIEESKIDLNKKATQINV